MSATSPPIDKSLGRRWPAFLSLPVGRVLFSLSCQRWTVALAHVSGRWRVVHINIKIPSQKRSHLLFPSYSENAF